MLSDQPQDGMIYRHYKGGLYRVLNAHVRHTETYEELVVYQHIQSSLIYARPLDVWLKPAKRGEEVMPRFVIAIDQMVPEFATSGYAQLGGSMLAPIRPKNQAEEQWAETWKRFQADTHSADTQGS